MTKIRLVTEPTVVVLADMKLRTKGLNELLDWVQDYRPECVPDELPTDATERAMALFPHAGFRDGRTKAIGHDAPRMRFDDIDQKLTDNELLTELAGRECYHSYGLKAGRKDNAEYIARMIFPDDPTVMPHASVAYHAKMTFFIAGISRRVSQELMRHYVGADRNDEGSPSQESTRYTNFPGHFAVPPRVLEAGDAAVERFRSDMQLGYDRYCAYIEHEVNAYVAAHGAEPKQIDRKRIWEAAAGLLPWQFCTSVVWTTNPIALGKLFRERCSEAADAEFYRFATKWRDIARAEWPNLFTGVGS